MGAQGELQSERRRDEAGRGEKVHGAVDGTEQGAPARRTLGRRGDQGEARCVEGQARELQC
jgi:hypothetical protein